jgi:hypothetical protein
MAGGRHRYAGAGHERPLSVASRCDAGLLRFVGQVQMEKL